MNQFKTRILLHKRCFDLGLALTGYIKLIVAVVGIGGVVTGSKLWVAILLISYAFFCYCFGRAYIHYGWYAVDIEIGNLYDPFVKEMRKKIK